MGSYCVFLYFALSGLLLFYSLKKVFELFYVVLLMREKNWLERYGKDGYALVTGATDGIGWEFCRSLAKRGFNIILVSRNMEKLQSRIQDLNNLVESLEDVNSSSIEFKNSENLKKDRFIAIAADFTDGYQVSFYDNIKRQLEGYNISLLINNVGVLNSAKTPDEAIRMINVNTLPQAMLTKMLLPNFHKRLETLGKKSGIINVSSIASKLAQPGFYNCYNATKAFNEYFSEGFNLKYKEKFDTLTVNPYFVSSNMTYNIKLDWQTCSGEHTCEES